jgi:hypothetical protein
MAGNVGTWFAVAPDDSIIFMRTLDHSEVYSLHYREM